MVWQEGLGQWLGHFYIYAEYGVKVVFARWPLGLTIARQAECSSAIEVTYQCGLLVGGRDGKRRNSRRAHECENWCNYAFLQYLCMCPESSWRLQRGPDTPKHFPDQP